MTTVRAWTTNVRLSVLLISLVALPYCIAVGTSNLLPPQIIVSLASWGTLFSLVGYSSLFVGQARIAPAILSALFAIMVATQVVNSGFYPTYHMSRSLSEQTEPVNVGKIGLVYLDEDTRKFVLDIGHAAETCSIAPGRPFVGLYDIPGVALIIQGIPVLTPWLSQPPQAEAWLKRAPDATLQSAIVGLRAFGDGEFPKMPGVLPSFPVGYRLCGEGVFPDWKQRIQLWAPDR